MAASDDDAPARPDRGEQRREEQRRDEQRRDDRREEQRREEQRRDDRREERERDRDGDGDSFTETLRQRLEQLVPDLVKKTFAAGMGAVFQTEEGIRRIARENLPEVAGYIASSADGAKDRVNDAKDRVFDVIARETREFLSNLNVGEEITKILTTLSFEIKTEIRFIPNSERFTGAEPDVKASVRLKRNDRDGKDRDGKDRDGKDRDDDEDGGRRSRLRFWQRDRDPGRDARDVVRDGVRDGSGSGSGGGGSSGGSGGGTDRDEDDNSGEK